MRTYNIPITTHRIKKNIDAGYALYQFRFVVIGHLHPHISLFLLFAMICIITITGENGDGSMNAITPTGIYTSSFGIG